MIASIKIFSSDWQVTPRITVREEYAIELIFSVQIREEEKPTHRRIFMLLTIISTFSPSLSSTVTFKITFSLLVKCVAPSLANSF